MKSRNASIHFTTCSRARAFAPDFGSEGRSTATTDTLVIRQSDAGIGVYSRPQAISSLAGSAKEGRMGSTPLNRRALLKSGAAFAGGLTLGAAAPAIGGQQAPESHHAPPSWPMIKGDKNMVAYGDRSKYVTSVRIAHPVDGGLLPINSG